MSDNITLPREVVKFVLQHLEWWSDDEPQEKEAIEALRTALAAEQPKHPGYVIGSHWLETAYSRVCAGEAEADVLRDIGLVREEAFLTGVAHLKAENEALRRDAERYRWLRDNAAGFSGRTLDAAIDAAMKEDKT